MDPSPESHVSATPAHASGRRRAVRSLAGIGAASLALAGRIHAAGGTTTPTIADPAAPGSLTVQAAKKKRGKCKCKGAGTITQESETFPIGEGGTQSGQANCLSGQATGGGAGLSNTNCAVISGGPVGASAWAATAKCPPGQTATMTVTVICLAAS